MWNNQMISETIESSGLFEMNLGDANRNTFDDTTEKRDPMTHPLLSSQSLTGSTSLNLSTVSSPTSSQWISPTASTLPAELWGSELPGTEIHGLVTLDPFTNLSTQTLPSNQSTTESQILTSSFELPAGPMDLGLSFDFASAQQSSIDSAFQMLSQTKISNILSSESPLPTNGHTSNEEILRSLFDVASSPDFLSNPFLTMENNDDLNNLFLSPQAPDLMLQGQVNQSLQHWGDPAIVQEAPKIAYGPETLKWIEAIYDESISVNLFIHQMAIMMCSHVSRFLNLFETAFIQWILWMQKENAARFRHYMVTHMKQLLDHDHEVDRHGILKTLLTKHFLDPPNIPRRIQAFLYSAKIFCNELDDINCGFCPRDHLPHVSYYPFHLVQLVRASLTRELRKMWMNTAPSKPDGAHSLIELNSLASDLWILETGHGNTKEMGPFHISLVPVTDFLADLNQSPKHHFLIKPFLWPSVFSDTLPFSSMFLFEPSLSLAASPTLDEQIMKSVHLGHEVSKASQSSSASKKSTNSSTKRRQRNSSAPYPSSSSLKDETRRVSKLSTKAGSSGSVSKTQVQVMSALQGAYSQSDHHLATYRDFEMMCARLISQCMVDFVSTAIKQSIKRDLSFLKGSTVTTMNDGDSSESEDSFFTDGDPAMMKKAAWDFIEKCLTTRFAPSN